MKSTLRALVSLCGLLLATSCADAPEPPSERGLAIEVSALNLAGVGDVVWDLEVVNGAAPPETVWQRRVSSSRYGDGAGSASYVGTCDASANPNTVRVWVVGVYSAPVTSAGAFASGALDGVGSVTGTPTPFQNPTTVATPLTRTIVCREDADVAVRFDVALMRPAQQGFFDIAVNFNDVFCAAKFDCCDDADDSGTCDSGEDIDLLFTAGAGRGRTMVLGFACTAGTTDTDATTLYLDPLAFDCTSPASGFVADFYVNPAAAAPGNQCDAGSLVGCPAITGPGAAGAGTYLFQVAVYRGDELLTSAGQIAHKVYWNVALGVTGAIGDCALRTRGTADDPSDALDGLVGGVVEAGAVYPFVSWDVPLGACVDEALTFDGTGPVRTVYTGTQGGDTAFAYAFAPGLAPTPVCASPCQHGGTCTAPGTCTCAAGYTGAVCETDIDDCSPNPCQHGGTCSDGVDSYSCSCEPGFTGDDCETAEFGTSCLALSQSGVTASGVYTLDPDGDGLDTFSAYCDMTPGDAGWTLVMRFAASGSQLTFNSPYWTNAAVLNATSLDPTTLGDAKYPAYAAVPGGEIRGCLRHPTTLVYGCKGYAVGGPRTALNLFTTTPIGSDSNGTGGLYFAETDAARYEWLTLQGRTLSQSSTPSPGYVRTGVNIDDDMSCYDARVRFGLALNNETTVYTLNDAAGFGASAYATLACDYAATQDAPWSVGAGFASGSTLYTTAGHIWMR
ncbi:MAG: hypothetical protein CVU56_00995 [Deltaproteobacteria bacterium HGW-Deltaproteobacteria-14]|nr:MAG: hypothetical protein CVU56_00995 [Deltaproteobacteria bacterium HGW-Deltaproteobacteria-14]